MWTASCGHHERRAACVQFAPAHESVPAATGVRTGRQHRAFGLVARRRQRVVQDPAAGIEVGDTLDPVMLSPCVGGLVRTWHSDGSSRLWGVTDPSNLVSVMGRGVIARTLREERRYREAALLNERTSTLLLQPRRPTATHEGTLEFAGRSLQLTEPRRTEVVAVGRPQGSAWSGRALHGRNRRAAGG